MTVAVLKDVSSRPSRQSEEAFNMLLSQAQERAMRWGKIFKTINFQENKNKYKLLLKYSFPSKKKLNYS